MGKLKTIAKYGKRELAVDSVMRAGYSRSTAAKWIGRCNDDTGYWGKACAPEYLNALHKAGFLYSSVKRYGIEDIENTEYISDLDYLSLKPFNNSFIKWIEDIYTASRVLKDHSDVFRTVYFSIIQRDGQQLILPNGGSDKKCTADDIAALVREKGELELRPVFWNTTRERYELRYDGASLLVNGQPTSVAAFRNKIVGKLDANYIVADPVNLHYMTRYGVNYDHTIKFWMANDSAKDPEVKSVMITFFYNKVNANGRRGRRVCDFAMVDIRTGEFTFKEENYKIPNWEAIVEKMKAVSNTIRQINFYTVSIALDLTGSFQIVYFEGYPERPRIPYNSELNEYLKSKVVKREYSLGDHYKAAKSSLKSKMYSRHVKKYGRPGVRPYMQKLWESAIKDDLKNTKGVSRSMKRWMHEHGFYSYRIWQYGITQENYKDFVLSDYDYYWLNRINNDYQKWVNDKTTYRMIMEPLKDYVPKYYLSIFKVKGESVITRQYDLPENVSEDFEGVKQLLRDKKKLAFKPSAGTHGDGFYCLEYHDDSFWANGEAKTEEELRDLIFGQKSFYLLTEYICMHDDLKKIYDKSVNTVRVIVVNSHGYDPQIMQQYIRIGSLRTGYTDNVGYGGICAMIDNETGEIYKPESIKDHYFYDCPVHPDTGTPIAGKLPNWDMMREGIYEISRYLGELEYLGYDVAITNEGMEIIEINIHPDLHKVADISDDFKKFFVHQKKKKAYKNNIDLSEVL